MVEDLKNCLKHLKEDGVILYPTDTIWGLGCDALSSLACHKIYEIKNRPQNKSVITLVSNLDMISEYADANLNDQRLKELLYSPDPTTIIYKAKRNTPVHLVSEKGEIAIRWTKDKFCAQLIEEYGKPITSTSANLSGHSSPKNFAEIHATILNEVDYVVNWRRLEELNPPPSTILKIDGDEIIKIR